jgi:tetratricopeptide (TPR) repeat protein
MRCMMIACFLVGLAYPAVAKCQQEIVVTKLTGTFEHGVGSEYRSAVAAANAAAIDARDLDHAESLLEPAVHYCEQQHRPGRIAVSVADAREYDHFMATHHDGVPVEWIDHACPGAFKTAAFIAVERKDFSAALEMLAKAAEIAPYWPEPLTEQGFVLNQLGKHAEALAKYRGALELANGFPAATYAKALTLRGLGFTLVELQDFARARDAYQQSLQLEPDNPLAKRELDYIRKHEAAGATGP